jgi:hypothetical protein
MNFGSFLSFSIILTSLLMKYEALPSPKLTEIPLLEQVARTVTATNILNKNKYTDKTSAQKRKINEFSIVKLINNGIKVVKENYDSRFLNWIVIVVFICFAILVPGIGYYVRRKNFE